MKIEKIKDTIICGDSLTVLKKFPDNFINCCITSPPYWRLRDYGTAQWKGGDPNCTHEVMHTKKLSKKQLSNYGTVWRQASVQCATCGALRIDKQVGIETSLDDYIEKLVCIFREVRRVLRDDGTFWLNIGDSYSSGGRGISKSKIQSAHRGTIGMPKCKKIENLKDKELVGVPWRVAFALQADGWYLRQDIIWHKPNPMPESVKDRCTKAHEYIFLLSKSHRYYFDHIAIQEPAAYDGRKDTVMKGSPKYDDAFMPDGLIPQTFHSGGHERWPSKDSTGRPMRNKRSVWTIPTNNYRNAHFATFPPKLIEPCILAGCPDRGIVLDPFIGSGTVAEVAIRLGRSYVGIELNPIYVELANKRLKKNRLWLFADRGQ